MSNLLNMPEIEMVRHARAKRLKLAVSAKGVRLTIPPYATQQQVNLFVQKNHVWIAETWTKLQQNLQHKSQVQTLPEVLQFAYLDQPFCVRYQDLGKHLFVLRRETENTVYIHEKYAAYALTQFTIRMAKQVLSKQLQQYASHHQFQLNKVRIATPTTRWGSCNHQQNIMLHAGLMLMPQHYVDYVLLHELTHTQHMHHQASFWRRLEQGFPQAKATQKEVKKFRLPFWWQTKCN